MSTNLADLVLRHAARCPDRIALTIPTSWDDDGIKEAPSVTYRELGDRIERFRGGLRQAGFVEGDRFVVMFPVTTDLYALVLALLADGMIAVFVDLGMGKNRVMQALRLSQAKAIVSVDRLLKLWPVVRVLWGRKRYSVDRARLGVSKLDALLGPPASNPPLERQPRAPALMTFTSGSTGEPRAANRTHDLLIAQHHALAEEFPNDDDDVDMTCFPVVPLHNLCCGITTVMPAVDLREPASVNAALVVDQIVEHGVTRLTAAPAFLARIADEAERRGEGLESVTHLGSGGAPTPRALCRRLTRAMPDAQLYVIYGSTEAEPIAKTTMKEFADSEGDGYLVGTLADAATVEVVELPEPLPELDEEQMVPYRVAAGEVGEIVVRGPHVLRGYVDDPTADAETKLRAPDDGVWHRTGDTGYWDEQHRLWLVGRMSDTLQIDGRTIHPLPLEAELDALPRVRRCALIMNPHSLAAELVVQPEPGEASPQLVAELRTRLAERDLPRVGIEVVDEIPMDPRHNSKIARTVLREQRAEATPIPKTR